MDKAFNEIIFKAHCKYKKCFDIILQQTFVRRIMGMPSTTNEGKIVTPEEHLNMAHTSIKIWWKNKKKLHPHLAGFDS